MVPFDSDPAAMDVANAVLASLGVGSAEGFGPGAYDCTVYWYGFLDQGARLSRLVDEGHVRGSARDGFDPDGSSA